MSRHGGECGVVCVVLSLILSISAKKTFEAYINEEVGRMSPDNPFVTVGDNVTLTCTIGAGYRGTHNASAMTFRCGGERVGASAVVVIDSRTAQMTHYDITGEQLLCLCVLPNASLGEQYVRIKAYRPTPQLSGCVVDSWATMTCCWSPSVEDHGLQLSDGTQRLDTQLYWSTVANSTTWSQCSDSRAHRCHWSQSDAADSFQMGATYYIYVRYEPPIGDDWHIYTVDTALIVKPGPVSQLAVLADNGTSLTVGWSMPASASLAAAAIIVQLNYSTDGGDASSLTQQWSTSNSGGEQRRLSVRPFTGYTVAVRTRPQTGGSWSEVTSLRLKTRPTRLKSNPSVSSSGFEVDGMCDHDCRVVFIHWQSLPRNEWNSPFVVYDLQFRSVDLDVAGGGSAAWQRVALSSDKTQVEIHCSLQSAVEVFIRARNSEGSSSASLKRIIIPKHDDVLPAARGFVATYHRAGGFMRLRWAVDEARTACDGSLTLYWCVGASGHCKESVQWRDVTGSNTTYDVHLPSGGHFRDYQFGIAVNTLDSTSGIHWADCLYLDDGIADIPTAVHFSAYQEVSSLSIEWVSPRCHERRGYVTGYRILFCRAQGSDSCTEVQRVAMVTQRGDVTHFTLRNLTSDIPYRVQMQTLTAAGASYRTSQPIYQSPVKPLFMSSTIVIIAISVLVPAAFLVIGVIVLVLKCKRLQQWYVKGLKIKMPERKMSLHTSTTSDLPLTSPDKWPYLKQVSYSVRSTDSGTGSLEGAVTPPPSDPHFYATPTAAVPLMATTRAALSDDDDDDDDNVFLEPPVTPSPVDYVKRSGSPSCQIDVYALASTVPLPEGATVSGGGSGCGPPPGCREAGRDLYVCGVGGVSSPPMMMTTDPPHRRHDSAAHLTSNPDAYVAVCLINEQL